MGLLGNILSDAISSGVKKGIGNAVGKAVEKVVKPTVDNLAEKSAEHINATAESLEKSASELRQASAGTDSSSSSLESAFGGLKSRLEGYATEISKNMKVCPECGEACSMDKQFCPSCGTKLPEESAAAGYTCKACGHVNVPGSKHCGKCGAVLPAAEAEVARQKAADDAVLAMFAEKLPQYPVWSVGGHDFGMSDNGQQCGHTIWALSLEGKESLLDDYAVLLKDAGFEHSSNPCHNVYHKVIGSECFVCDMVDAWCDGSISLNFYVDNSLIKKDQPSQSETIDVAGLAKGLFKKLF